MVKDEDSLPPLRPPTRRDASTAAWDMQQFWNNVAKAGEVKYANLV